MTDVQTYKQRMQNLRALIDRFQIDLSADYSGAEDLQPYLDGDEHTGRFAAVTAHDDWIYILPAFETREAASERAAEHVDDDIFTETPLEVVDLDVGTRWLPRIAVTWNPIETRED